MNDYSPRPGSKTEAAVTYLRAQGGAATAIDIADEIDTERKNLQACFSAAIGAGLLEPCDLPAGVGYRLCGTDAPGTPRPAPRPKVQPEAPPKAQSLAAVSDKDLRRADLRRIVKVEPYTCATSKAKPAKPAKPAKTVKPDHPAPDPAAGDPAAAATFRVGEYSDGTLRLEGLDPALIVTNGCGERMDAVILSPAAARILVEFMHPAGFGGSRE